MKKFLQSFVSFAVYQEEKKKRKTYSGNGIGRLTEYEKQIFWEKLHFFMRLFLKVEL